jgi:hypothetical protein
MASSRTQTLSGTATIVAEEGFYLIDNSSVLAVITFPDATLMKGKSIITAINTIVVANTVTMNPVAGQKLSGLASVAITLLTSRTWYSDGSNWY